MQKVVATIEKNRSEEVRVELSEFNGHDLVSARVWLKGANGTDPTPTRKGITLRIELLPALREALNQAEQEARAAGLLSDDLAA